MDTLSTADLVKLFLTIVFGATGTYLLLPHSLGKVKPKLAHFVGLVLVAVAVIAISGFWKVGKEVELVSRLFFYLFAFMAVGCAILTITSRDPVHSALWFAAVVLATSGLFLLSGAQFLAAGTVIVYAGAIIVTFLFVIMLAQKEGRALYDRMARAPFFATLSSFLLLLGLIVPLLGMRPLVLDQDGKPPQASLTGNAMVSMADRLDTTGRADLVKGTMPNHKIVLERVMGPRSTLPERTPGKAKPAHVASLGAVLFTDHLLTIELAGSLLFVALIGALAIATPKPPIRPTVGTPSTTTTA